MISVFSEFESKMLDVSKIEEDMHNTRICARLVVHASYPFRATWLRQLHVSPLN